MRETLINSGLAISLLACLQTASASDALQGMLTIDVMDPRSEVTQNINDRLLLRLKSEGDHEWEIQVIKRPSAEFPENLLYHSDQWHGPYPTQVLRGTFRRNIFQTRDGCVYVNIHMKLWFDLKT